MTETTTLIPSESTVELAIRLRTLREQWLTLRKEVREAQKDALNFPRQHVRCLRCGYDWKPYDPFVPPITCARCGTTAWMLPPTSRSRKPSDPHPPSWRTRKGRRRAKTGDTVLRYRVEQITRTKQVRPTRTFISETPLAPWERADGVTGIPPPPPIYEQRGTIAISLAPSPAYEEQPERQTSHVPSDVVAAPEEVIPEPSADDNPAPPAPPADATPPPPPPVDIPPDQIGVPQTDAEREELEKAKVDAWPTTRGDD